MTQEKTAPYIPIRGHAFQLWERSTHGKILEMVL